jgi:hypothetical protein
MSHAFTSRTTLAAVASFAALAAAPLAASAYAVTPPVAVTACSVETQAPTFVAGEPMPPDFGSVNVSFTNRADVAATNVEVLVSYAGTTQRLDSATPAAPGAAVQLSAAALPYVNASDVTCKVARVDFSDGTSWNRIAAVPRAMAQR